ncbi:MAG: hypothetical protein IT521_12650 [Burkholderiales bacterium]|nr:hypothetical protein [Burkholderiales bacterium]
MHRYDPNTERATRDIASRAIFTEMRPPNPDAPRAAEARLDAAGAPADDLAYSLGWHDWLNLQSLLTVSHAVVAAALVREDSCGAHYREDHPDAGDPQASYFTCVTWRDGCFPVTTRRVSFTRVRPGETLLQETGLRLKSSAGTRS